MKVFVQISCSKNDVFGPAFFAALEALYPEGVQTNRYGITLFRCYLPQEEPRTHAILETFRQHGFHPWKAFETPQPNEFRMRLQRVYDKRDFEQAQYLTPKPKRMFGIFSKRTPEGLLTKEAADIKPKADIGGMYSSALFISERLRPQVEQAGFLGAQIKPLELIGPGSKRLTGQFWELSSTVTLPPLSPKNALIDAQADPMLVVERHHPTSYVLREGIDAPDILYDFPELHYRAADLAAMPPFDIALTAEEFGIEEPYTVVSPKFYQFCCALKLPMDSIPVRIDPAENDEFEA